MADGELDAALAGAFAGQNYGLAVLVPDAHDRPDAVTRFVVVTQPGPLPAADRIRPHLAGRVPRAKTTPGR